MAYRMARTTVTSRVAFIVTIDKMRHVVFLQQQDFLYISVT